MDWLSDIVLFLNDKELSVPMGQVAMFAILSSFCLFFGRLKLGLIISYAFVFYWGFVFNHQHFVDILGKTTYGMYVYIAGGTVSVLMAVVGFFQAGSK